MSSVAWIDRLVSAADVEIRELGEVVAAPWDKYYFFFIDDQPGANWSHPCRYVFLSEDGSSFAVLYKQLPPRIFSVADGSRIYLKAAGKQDESTKTDAVKQFNAVTAKVYSYANSLKEENDLSYSTGDRSRSHFVLICGGGDPESNGIRFWCDTAMLYSTLTLKYGVSKANIHVYMSDGTSTDADANLGSVDAPVLVSSPLDLDGDGDSDIDGAATKSEVRSCFNSLQNSLSSADQLFVFVTSHGSPEGTAGPNNYGCLAWLYAADGGSYGSDGERAYFWDEDLAEWTSGMACPVAFAIETCYSGGFIDDITQTPKRVIATACNHCESSYGTGGGGTWGNNQAGMTTAANCWAKELISALRGVHPRNLPDREGYYWHAYPWQDDTDIPIDADSNGDGLVSFSEARTYAYENDEARCTRSSHTSTCGKDNKVEHPQYAESTASLGAAFYVLNQSSPAVAAEEKTINIPSDRTYGTCTLVNNGSSWKTTAAFPEWVKSLTWVSDTGNMGSLAHNVWMGFSGAVTLTVNCTTNDTGSARHCDISITNKNTKAIQYVLHINQSPYEPLISAPTAPTVSVSTYGSNANISYINVSWSAAARATSYNVYRNTSNSTSGRTKVATNVTSPYKDYVSNGLTPGVKYWYWVEAVNSAGSSFSGSDWGNILVSASLSKTALGFTAAGGTSNITVTANTSWSASTSASWLSISTSGTSGNGSIAVTAAPNANTSSRSGYVIATAGAGTSYPKAVTNVVTQAAGVALQTALDNTTLSFTTGGSSSWVGQASTTHDGVDAAQSGVLGNSQTNWLQTTVSGTGTISFWWYVSSEQGYDFLEFLIDGSVVASMSGTNNVWTSKSFDISTSGTHTLQWRYRKDGSQYRGLDAGFVDQVTWTPSVVSAPVWTINAAGTLTAVELNGCTDIVIPEGVTSLASYVFSGLAITSVRFSSTLETVGSRAFENCSHLTNITFSTGLKSLGQCSFVGCSSLSGVFELPEGLTRIGRAFVFGSCKISDIVLPATLTLMDEQEFIGCSSITNVWFKGNAPSVPDGSSRSDQYKYETSPYYGASEKLVSYVPYGSTGWQNSSSALPSQWPTKTWENYAARPIRNYIGEPPRGTSGVVPSTSPMPTAYTVTYLPGSYASGSTYTATKTNDVALVLRGSTYTRTGYTQTGWSTNSVGTSKSYNLSASYTANSAITLYPYWTPNTYSVTYALNGGTHGATHPTTATYDTAFYVSAPTKSGYTFAGWTVTSGLNTSTAKWGTSSNPSTSLTSSTTKCANGATGNVYFKNLTSTSIGSVTLTANWTPVTALPDLCPYTPAGWSGSLVLSTESQNATNSTATSFSPNDAIYVSLAVVNLGVGFSNDFNWALYVDGSLRTTGANWGSGLAANGYSRWFALPIGPLPPGTHTIKVMYDYVGRLAESDESNNTVTKTVIVSGTVVRPSNDNFAGATTISGMSGSVTGSNVNATCESGEPLPNISAGATNTIWWTWTAPATGIAQVSTAGSKVSYTAVGAYVGSPVSALTTVAASADSYSQSSISFSVAAGTRYYIAVSGTDYRYQGTVKLTWSMFTPVPLNTALDNASLTFTTGGSASWVGVSDESYYGGSSARSGIITDSQSTWMQTEVAGEGTLSFWYKVSSESYCDKLIFYVDGVQKTMASGTVGWTRFECVVSNNTQHVLMWTYSKDGSVSSGSDCCWIDEVAFSCTNTSATSTTPEPVPYSWLNDRAASLLAAHGGDYEAAGNATAANGVNKVWECYVAGIDPEDADAKFEATITMGADGKPVVAHDPPLTEEEAAKRTYRTLGKRTLDPAEEWTDVTDETDLEAAGWRFFKVKVEMK